MVTRTGGAWRGGAPSDGTTVCLCTDACNAHELQDFRIAATGVVLELDKSADIVKKLKLTGYPMKVFKNTAFIKNMFTSPLEVARCVVLAALLLHEWHVAREFGCFSIFQWDYVKYAVYIFQREFFNESKTAISVLAVVAHTL